MQSKRTWFTCTWASFFDDLLDHSWLLSWCCLGLRNIQPVISWCSLSIYGAICVDVATHLNGVEDSFPAHLICLVGRYVEFEKARVGLWEGLLVPTKNQLDLVFLCDFSNWQSGPSPDKLKVECSIILGEPLKDAPEPLYHSVTLFYLLVHGDSLQLLNFKGLLTTNPILDSFGR